MVRAAIIEAPLPEGREQPTLLQVRGCLCPAVPAYGAITVQAAQQDAAASRPRLAQNCQHPVEVARIAHRPFQSDKDSLECRKGTFRIVADIFDIDVAELPRNRLYVGGFVGIRSGRQAAVEAVLR